MKTKITAIAVVLALALAATAVAANLSGSARTIPMPKPGDPISGVLVSLIATSGGKPISSGRTNDQGVFEFTAAPCRCVIKIDPGTSSNYNSSRSNTAGISIDGQPEQTVTFRDKAVTLSVEVLGPGSKRVKVSTKEGQDPKRN
jgi:hypothetical protein